MKGKLLLGMCGVCVIGVAIWFVGYRNRQLVFVGDTENRVFEMLGLPNIEFPKNGKVVQWYAGYEIVVSNDVVTNVRMIPVASKKEKLEKQRQTERAEERLRESYQATAVKEDISYRAWLKREENRAQEERERRLVIDEYEKRKLEKEKQAMRYQR